MKKLFILLSLICTTAVAHAQTGTVKGKVVSESGQPAINVSVSIENSDAITYTDSNGEYELQTTTGKHHLIIKEIGKEKIDITINVKDNEVTNIRKVSLQDLTDETLDEVVIGGNRKSYKADRVSNSLRLQSSLLETPQNIQVITGKTLQDQQIISMSDGVLRNVSGATRLEHWGDLYARVNMRGSRASAFRNGMNTTSTWGPLTEDMSFVDHIEFVKGPAGFMMSYGEPSGMYNVVTKKPTGNNHAAANITIGSYDLYRAAVDLDGKMDKEGKLLYRLNVMGQTKNSFRDYEYNNRYSIAPVLSYKIDDKTTVTAEYILQHVNMSNLGSYYAFAVQGYGQMDREFTMNEPGLDPTRINDHNINFTVEHRFNDNWKLTTKASYFNYQQQGSSMWLGSSVDAAGDIIRSVSIWDASNIMKFGQAYLNGEVKTGVVNHRILASLDLGNKEYMADWSQGHLLDTTGSFNIYNPNYGNPANGLPNFDRTNSLRERATASGSIITQSYSSVYLQDELGFFENALRLTLAGRYTYAISNSYGTVIEGKRFTPRVGISYSIDDQTSVYGVFDQTFVPQTGIRKDGGSIKPITGNNMEIGFKRDWFDAKWNTTLAVYQILKNNQNTNDPNNSPIEQYVVQLGQTKTRGVELDIRGEILPGLTLVANYAYTDSKISKASEAEQATIGNKVPGYATHVAHGWLNYKMLRGPLSGFGISGGFNFEGDRSTWTWAGATGQAELPDYFRIDGGIFYEMKKVRLTANMFNVADKYLYSGAAYGTYYYWQAEAGRNWRFSIDYNF